MMTPPSGPQDPHHHKRLIIAIALSLLILLGYHFMFERPRLEAMQAREHAQQQAEAQKEIKASLPESAADARILSRDEALSGARINFKNSYIAGSLPLIGNRIDDVRLLRHYETVERVNHVALFSPSGTEKPYYAEFGFIAADKSTVVPGADTRWQVVGGNKTLTPDHPILLRWNNGQGLVFERKIAINEDYLFTVTGRVINNSDSPVTLHPYQLLSRKGLPKDYVNMYILHQGPIGFSGGELVEIGYNDLEEPHHTQNQGGWIGFTDKYWFASLIPDQSASYKARFTKSGSEDLRKARYQADTLSEAVTVMPNSSAETSFRLFAGAKKLGILDSYKGKQGIGNLELAIDFGIWSIITKPFYLALNFLSHLFGHVAWGIIVLTVLIRLVLFPLNSKSFRSMAAMKKVAPQLKEIQEKHKGDTQTMQVKIMELYQREKVNPFSGCWPVLLQIPIFFALYKVVMLDIEMRHASFPGWIDDMSVMDPTSIFNLFGLLPYDVPGFLMIGAWPLLMGMTMAAQRRLNPPPTDPMQAKMMAWMPVVFTFILAKFAAGLVIYWTWSNFLGVLQQYTIMRREGVDVSLIKGYKKAEVEEGNDT